MKQHIWKEREKVYDGVYSFKCGGCGACIISENHAPIAEDLTQQKLPLDCDEASVAVIHEEYMAWDEDDDVDEWPF